MKKDTQQFPTEEVTLPSKGLLYPEGSPLRSGKITMKYMTAKEEDILTNQNYIKNGTVIDKLLQSLIMDDVKVEDLLIGDKNAIMIAIRILAYGPDYTVEMIDPDTGNKFNHTFNLSELPYKDVPSDIKYNKNEFKFTLPTSKQEVIFKLLSGGDEKNIASELESLSKLNSSSN